MEHLHSALNHVIKDSQLGDQVGQLLETQMNQLKVKAFQQQGTHKTALGDEQTSAKIPVSPINYCFHIMYTWKYIEDSSS